MKDAPPAAAAPQGERMKIPDCPLPHTPGDTHRSGRFYGSAILSRFSTRLHVSLPRALYAWHR